jgi:hypothetical protein
MMPRESFAAEALISSSYLFPPFHARTMSFACPLFRRPTESQKVYTITYAEFRKAVNLLCQVRPCPISDCDCCTTMRELMAAQNVVKYIGSAKFKAQKLLAETTMS